MKKEYLKKIKELVDIGLKYNVDYIYVLQDIQKLLNNIDVNIKKENYIEI